MTTAAGEATQATAVGEATPASPDARPSAARLAGMFAIVSVESVHTA